MKRLLALAGLLVALGILAGCGGSGGRVGDTLAPDQRDQLYTAANMDGEYYADVDFYRLNVINDELISEPSSGAMAMEAMNTKMSRAARDVPGGIWSGPDAAGWYTYTAPNFVARIRYFAGTREVEYAAEYYDTLLEIGHEVHARYFLNGDPFGGASVYPTT